jgi:hypothetical protein
MVALVREKVILNVGGVVPPITSVSIHSQSGAKFKDGPNKGSCMPAGHYFFRPEVLLASAKANFLRERCCENRLPFSRKWQPNIATTFHSRKTSALVDDLSVAAEADGASV